MKVILIILIYFIILSQRKLNLNTIIRMYIEDDCYEETVLKDQTNEPQKIRMPKQKHNMKHLLNQLNEENNSQDEGIQDYKIGGYHPVHIGEILINRYVVIQKLGWGHFSTVWLCKDFKYNTYVAVKIQKSSPHYMEAAFDEVQILQKIQTMTHSTRWSGKSRNDTHVVGMLNAFIYKSIYGNHFCMVFEILRCNLLDVIKMYNYEGVPLEICQQISKQVLQGLDYLHRICGVIHTDLKPQNVMLCLSKQQLKDIVENGQLNNKQLFMERIRFFRQVLGVKMQVEQKEEKQDSNENSSEIKLSEIEMKLKAQNLSKNQKKNLKKKIKKLRMDTQNYDNGKQMKKHEAKKHTFNLAELMNVRKGKIEMNNGNLLKLPIQVKIADLGNACWHHHHFSTQIQTRQYRSPQVILGQSYNQTADLWSLACMMYQMLTGDLLFQPKKNEEWNKNDDHLAQMQQLLGPFDINFIARSPKKSKYFTKTGRMKRLPVLNHYSLSTVLQLKNKIKQHEAKRFADFLLPMMIPQPQKRIKAIEALSHPWLKISKFDQNYKMNEFEHGMLKDEFYRNEEKFRQKMEIKQEHDASCEDNQIINDKLQNNRNRKQKNKYVFADIRYIDRSFTDLGYVGYCDGIDFDKLDSCTNWQFT